MPPAVGLLSAGGTDRIMLPMFHSPVGLMLRFYVKHKRNLFKHFLQKCFMFFSRNNHSDIFVSCSMLKCFETFFANVVTCFENVLSVVSPPVK